MNAIKFFALAVVLILASACAPGFQTTNASLAAATNSEGSGGDNSSGQLPSATPIPATGFIWGVNLSGGEYNLENTSARINFDYVFPSNSQIDYYASKGAKVIRLPFDANRLQPKRNGVLNADELARIQAVISYAKTKSIYVILDPHNYGTLLDNNGASRVIVKDSLMPASYFADLWSRVATALKNEPYVIYGLMNEPNIQTAAEWKIAAVAAINAIRATGSTQKIFVPGTAWTGAHSWISSGNAAAWAGFSDINFAIEAHQYLDSDSSGTHTACISGNGSKVLADITTWARAQKMKVFLGEIGWSTESSCDTEGNALSSFIKSNSDVWMGFSYWAAGPWLGEYMYTIEPLNLGAANQSDRAQMTLLKKYF